jgi:RND family efflux transporter MFP subunit
VNLRVSGWIEKLYADVEGMEVRKGQPLFDLYSPEVQVAVQELIAARKALKALSPSADPDTRQTSQGLFDAARQKLQRWGLTGGQVDALARQDQAPSTVAILSPIDGHIIEKRVYDGAAVKAGELVLRLSSRGTMWLDARIYEQDLPRVKVGQHVTAAIVAWPGKLFEGTISFIHPHLDDKTRSAMARVELPNPHHALRQGMYATVRISVPVAVDALTVPREAVLDTGQRQLVFVSEGAGHFAARQVSVGVEGDGGTVQVLSGLKAGERVVTSGQFLLDSESRLKEAIQKHLEEAPPKYPVH